jgi:uncharacterized Zn finger protein (UPF0148 family)
MEYCPYCGCKLNKAFDKLYCPNCGVIEELESDKEDKGSYIG